MDYICPHCDTELELVEIESYHSHIGSRTFTEYNSWRCPHCNREYQNQDEYVFVKETELYEV